jgi:hypothetical protein
MNYYVNMPDKLPIFKFIATRRTKLKSDSMNYMSTPINIYDSANTESLSTNHLQERKSNSKRNNDKDIYNVNVQHTKEVYRQSPIWTYRVRVIKPPPILETNIKNSITQRAAYFKINIQIVQIGLRQFQYSRNHSKEN